jgi:NADH pyrophosphatase NudC (nudix superfamily)
MKTESVTVEVIAGVVIKKDNKYLLVQEKKVSAYGLWNFPAGHVDIGESIEEAAIREAKEEVGYDVELVKKICVHQNSINEPVKHTFYAKITGGELNFPKDELLDAKWFSFDEIKRMKDKLRSGDWIIETITIFEKNKF